MNASVHTSVMLREVIEWLEPREGQTIVDGTLGGGGHTRAIAERVGPTGKVIALDQDPVAIERAIVSLKGLPVLVAQSNFDEVGAVLEELEIERVDGIVLDLGISSDQLADEERGFTFRGSGELDMRFDPQTGTPAWKLLESLGEKELADLIYEFGEERLSRRIARKIVHERSSAPIRTANRLADIVRSCYPRGEHRIDPATRTFQALRIAVNRELDSLKNILELAPKILRNNGRMVIISFHSLEDRIVKHAFREASRWNVLTKRPIEPRDEEIDDNPRARSAKLRAAKTISA